MDYEEKLSIDKSIYEAVVKFVNGFLINSDSTNHLFEILSNYIILKNGKDSLWIRRNDEDRIIYFKYSVYDDELKNYIVTNIVEFDDEGRIIHILFNGDEKIYDRKNRIIYHRRKDGFEQWTTYFGNENYIIEDNERRNF